MLVLHIGEKMLKYVDPSCDDLTHAVIGDISGSSEWISTKLSEISLGPSF